MVDKEGSSCGVRRYTRKGAAYLFLAGVMAALFAGASLAPARNSAIGCTASMDNSAEPHRANPLDPKGSSSTLVPSLVDPHNNTDVTMRPRSVFEALLRNQSLDMMTALPEAASGTMDWRDRPAMCPCCGFRGPRHAFGDNPIAMSRRADVCPHCGSRVRQRRMCVHLGTPTVSDRIRQLNSAHRVFRLLHTGAEPMHGDAIDAAFHNRSLAVDQIRSDFDPSRYGNGAHMSRIDLQDMQLPAQFLDGILTAQVLEHLPDMRRGLLEMHRVLRNANGWVLIEWMCHTEVPSVTRDCRNLSAREKFRVCSQDDHQWLMPCGVAQLHMLRTVFSRCVPWHEFLAEELRTIAAQSSLPAARYEDLRVLFALDHHGFVGHQRVNRRFYKDFPRALDVVDLTPPFMCWK